MPALRAFVLGVGHMRRNGMRIGEMSSERAMPMEPSIVQALRSRLGRASGTQARPRSRGDRPGLWERLAQAAGIDPQTFLAIAEDLDRRSVIGRFSTFLEHSKPVAGEERLARFNGLFHWAVPRGRELEAGSEIGRFAILTHCYWRDAGPELNDVNIMAVAHGQSRNEVLAHKVAIDQHLFRSGIGFTYTNTYWGGRAEIKPSEISPMAYRQWARNAGLR
jgi:AsnC-like protein